jgi:RimJ/RimL family protein N-acetyltransferase
VALDTVRLRLLPYAPENLLTLIEAPEQFEERFGYPAAEGLHDFFVSDEVSPTWLALLQSAAASGSGADPWAYGFAIVHRESRQVIGSASFKGPPDAAGVVEIAYGVVPRYEGQGYTTEAVRALLDFAWSEPRVRLVRAHTAPRPGASPRILRKCGFTHVGAVDDPEDGLVWRWERAAEPV